MTAELAAHVVESLRLYKLRVCNRFETVKAVGPPAMPRRRQFAQTGYLGRAPGRLEVLLDGTQRISEHWRDAWEAFLNADDAAFKRLRPA
jgi:hypothetical protein